MVRKKPIKAIDVTNLESLVNEVMYFHCKDNMQAFTKYVDRLERKNYDVSDYRRIEKTLYHISVQ